MMRTLKVAVVVLALFLAGCSLYMKTNAKNWEPRLAPTCSTHKTAPLLDTIAAGLGVVAAGVGAGCLWQENGDTTRDRCTTFVLAPGIVTAIVYGVPALVGWHNVRKCKRAWRKHEGWLRPEYPGAEQPETK